MERGNTTPGAPRHELRGKKLWWKGRSSRPCGGKNQAAEIQLAQAVARAAAAIRTTEQAIHDFDNGSGPAEAAYDEAEAALTSLMTADAALHPVVGSSTDGAGGKRGKGASSLGLDVHRDFMKGKKGGKGVPSIDDAQEREGAPDVDDAEYEEEVEEEEEEVVEDDEALVEVELEVIPEEQEDGHDEERCEDPSLDLGENEDPTYSEAEHTEAFDDGQGPVSEPEAEEGDHSEAMASSGATAPPNFTTESLKRTTEGRSLGRPVEFPKALFLGPKILVAAWGVHRRCHSQRFGHPIRAQASWLIVRTFILGCSCLPYAQRFGGPPKGECKRDFSSWPFGYEQV